ncbi:hypothetical protein MMC21_004100 [Puttea exsequens]|nr:hypothetical protein [Puttea exsequens]
MAPKTLPPLAKQNLILTYFHTSLTAHTLKDLEKTLPSVASINGMQVKDYLQALHDEGRIQVEKIGSGNWYWSFLSEEKRGRESVLNGLRTEEGKMSGVIASLAARIEEATEGREDGKGRGGLVDERIDLLEEVGALKAELATYRDADPAEIEAKRKEIMDFQIRAGRWTDNICVLEGRLFEMMGGDREGLDGVKREVYGDEYVEGEGLREL